MASERLTHFVVATWIVAEEILAHHFHHLFAAHLDLCVASMQSAQHAGHEVKSIGNGKPEVVEGVECELSGVVQRKCDFDALVELETSVQVVRLYLVSENCGIMSKHLPVVPGPACPGRPEVKFLLRALQSTDIDGLCWNLPAHW